MEYRTAKNHNLEKLSKDLWELIYILQGTKYFVGPKQITGESFFLSQRSLQCNYEDQSQGHKKKITNCTI